MHLDYTQDSHDGVSLKFFYCVIYYISAVSIQQTYLWIKEPCHPELIWSAIQEPSAELLVSFKKLSKPKS